MGGLDYGSQKRALIRKKYNAIAYKKTLSQEKI